MSSTSFEIISVPVSDQEGARRFYRDVLEFDSSREEAMGLNGWFDSKRPDGLQGVTMNLTDIEQQPWGRFTMFKDPDGNGWILRQRPA